jgi:hypothetical protein
MAPHRRFDPQRLTTAKVGSRIEQIAVFVSTNFQGKRDAVFPSSAIRGYPTDDVNRTPVDPTEHTTTHTSGGGF